MAPKRSHSETGVIDPEDKESQRIKRIAIRSNVLASKIQQVNPTKVPEAIIKYDGANINNKSRSRGKKKFLFVFPGKLDVETTGGKMGTLDNLSSRNPVLYIEYPQGRLKLFGTIVYPKSKFLALNYKPNSSEKQIKKTGFQCRGTFDAFIVFSESRWIQEEEVLKDEEDVGDNDVENEGEEKSDDITREVIDLDDGDDDDGDDGSKKKRSSSRRRSGRVTAVISYKEESGSENDEEEDDEEEDDE
eukprot:jgi/Bigna1/90220/estExt_fgenesh1_pg.C_650063